MLVGTTNSYGQDLAQEGPELRHISDARPTRATTVNRSRLWMPSTASEPSKTSIGRFQLSCQGKRDVTIPGLPEDEA